MGEDHQEKVRSAIRSIKDPGTRKVTIKTLIVIHMTLREGDPTFREELLSHSHRGHVLQVSNFKDDSSPLAWDFFAWVRSYALFLEERLECFRIIKFDVEAEHLVKTSQGDAKPEGVACGNYLIQYALALLVGGVDMKTQTIYIARRPHIMLCMNNFDIAHLVRATILAPAHGLPVNTKVTSGAEEILSLSLLIIEDF